MRRVLVIRGVMTCQSCIVIAMEVTMRDCISLISGGHDHCARPMRRADDDGGNPERKHQHKAGQARNGGARLHPVFCSVACWADPTSSRQFQLLAISPLGGYPSRL